MADLNPGTDSPDTTTTPTGTVEPSNDQTGNPEGAQTAPSDDDALYKTVESLSWEKIDPARLPQSHKDRFVDKAEFTRKSQTFAEKERQYQAREQAILELARKQIVEKPTGPSPAELKRAELLELAAAGDQKSLDALVEMRVSERIAPIEQASAYNQAVARARATDPVVVENWDTIQAVIAANPDIAAMAQMDNFRYADKVFLALGLEQKALKLGQASQAQTQEIAGLKAKLAQYEKERVTGLPPTTTKAGTSTGRPAAGDFDTYDKAAYAAFIESGGRPQDWR